VPFLLRPCTTKEELFDRDEEIKEILRAIEKGSIIFIEGPRKSGKTSIAMVMLDILRDRGIRARYIDMEKDIVNGVDSEDLEIIVLDSIENLRVLRKKIYPLLSEIKDRNTIFILVDPPENSIELLKRVTRKRIENITTIAINEWDKDRGISYIQQGLKECGVNYSPNELREVIDTIGTLPGWLAIYGYQRCSSNLDHSKALEETIRIATEIAKKDLEQILSRKSPQLRRVIRMLVRGARWYEMLRETTVSPYTLNNFLKNLKRLYVVREEGGIHRIVDPIYSLAALGF